MKQIRTPLQPAITDNSEHSTPATNLTLTDQPPIPTPSWTDQPTSPIISSLRASAAPWTPTATQSQNSLWAPPVEHSDDDTETPPPIIHGHYNSPNRHLMSDTPPPIWMLLSPIYPSSNQSHDHTIHTYLNAHIQSLTQI